MKSAIYPAAIGEMCKNSDFRVRYEGSPNGFSHRWSVFTDACPIYANKLSDSFEFMAIYQETPELTFQIRRNQI